ncbi:MAG TPA: protein kinase, partial [Anaerolineales bacterium]|nr:protein kinase [Anaerolineales bacterium]
MPEWTGKTIGKVRIEKFLARGGMAEVYLGTHLTLERQVAVKVLHSFIEEDPGLLARFQREAKVVAGLRHSNIVQILDFDTVENHPYIVMEYLAGPSLAAYLRNLHERETRLAYNQVARLLKPLASALDYAHSQDIIHRDIKPANILLHSKSKASEFHVDGPLTEHVEPVVTDFGLVRIAHSTTQTTTGAISGTPAYMSPEQARGDRVDHRTDIYSLGVVLYEMLAGRVPFEADSGMTVLYMHINEPPPPIQGIHPALQGVIQRVLAKKPEDRYQTCRELAADFKKAIEQSAQSETIIQPVVPAPAPVPAPEPEPTVEKRKHKKAGGWKRIFRFAAVAFICICGLTIIRVLSNNEPNDPITVAGTELPFTKPTLLAFIDTMFPTDDVAATAISTGQPTIIPVVFKAPADGSIVGLLRFQDGTAIGNTLTLYTDELPPAPEGSRYQVWLVGDDNEQRISIGILRIGQDKTGAVIYWDEKGQNLLGKYSALQITLEPDPDDNPNPSETVAYSVRLPAGGLIHVRHLLVSFETTPHQIGFIHGLDKSANLLVASAEQMRSAFEEDDEEAVLLQAESMLNLIVGSQSPDYKDWNGDRRTSELSDGYGLLLNGDHLGYIQGTFTHAGLALTALDASPNMIAEGDYVKVCTNNVSDWSAQLRAQLIEVLQNPDNLNEDAVSQII